MNQGRIIVITGAPGTGKTTTASAVAKESDLEKSVHMHTDDFYHYLSKGAIPPHLPESNEQNLIVIEAFLEAAKRYARGGYDVIVDGIVGPWFLEPWLNIVQEHYEVHYIVLRASKEETMKRAIERSKLDRETNIELVETMWNQFSNLGIYELNVIDTTAHSIKDTVSAVKEKVDVLKKFIDNKNDFGFIAKINNKIVGFAFGYILLKPDGRKVFYLDAIDVMPDFQGKGYGTGLISFARDYAKTIDCYEMFLITNRSNISACKCYEKAGGINDADDEVVYVYDFREEN
jgi:ribosomal protein S18 acetylase RimI-like enzyme